MVKYTKNNFYALKVILLTKCTTYVKHWHRLVCNQRHNYNASRSTNWRLYLEPIMGLMRGFGGKCLPKDTLALRELARELNVDYDILDAMQSDNAALRNIPTGKPSDVITEDD